MEIIIILSFLLLIAIIIIVLLYLRINNIKHKYKEILDVDAEIEKRRTQIDKDEKESKSKIEINEKESSQRVENLMTSLNQIQSAYAQKEEELSLSYKNKKELFDELTKEVSILEDKLESMSYGLYEAYFKYDSSDEYKYQLKDIIDKQASLIRNNQATYCPIKWEVGGSKKEGEKMVKQSSKLMLKAFNGECDAAISKVSWNNVVNMEARISKAFENINKLGQSSQIVITTDYLNLKLQELRIEFELQEKIYQEKEEQRQIREQMREDEKVLKEIEKLQKDAETEELRYQKALEKAKEEVKKTTGVELDNLNEKIRILEENLLQAQLQKQRAISQAQLTKSGHVYVISNIGAFGIDMFKIGMTRRLDPMDRVKELGDASVPFDFDVHAIIYSENAPALENTFHKKFSDRKVNLMNERREFFYVSIEEIIFFTQELGLDIEITKLAQAKEYRASESIRNAKKQDANLYILPKFPEVLN